MNTPKKIEAYFNVIENIKYTNEHGGAYAYIQFMAYSRELLKLLRSNKKFERQLDAIEAINWLFNEYLAVKFTFRHQVIFETKLSETKLIFDSIRETLNKKHLKNQYTYLRQHAQAA